MTNKIKQAIEEAARRHADQFNRIVRKLIPAKDRPYESFIKGSEEIINNPERYGLMKIPEQSADSTPKFKCYEIHTVQARMYGCGKQCRECEIEEKSSRSF